MNMYFFQPEGKATRRLFRSYVNSPRFLCCPGISNLQTHTPRTSNSYTIHPATKASRQLTVRDGCTLRSFAASYPFVASSFKTSLDGLLRRRQTMKQKSKTKNIVGKRLNSKGCNHISKLPVYRTSTPLSRIL